jgi:hypothetical protein
LGLLEALMQILQWAVGGREGVSDWDQGEDSYPIRSNLLHYLHF